MSRLWFVVLLGWLLIIGSYGSEDEHEREHEARLDRDCGCSSGASVRTLMEPQRPLAEQLELAARRELGGAASAGYRLPAPRVDELVLHVSKPNYEPTADLAWTGELPKGAKQLALLFEIRTNNGSAAPIVQHALALAPATKLAGLGKPRCDTQLAIDLDDSVTVAVAAIDAAGQLGQVTQVEAKLQERSADRPSCGHGHCSHPGLLALLLGMCWTVPTVAMMIGALVVLAHRRSQFRASPVEPLSLGQLHRLCTMVSRTQVAYMVLGLLCSVALAVRYPIVAPTAAWTLLFPLLAALRYRAMRKLLALAERPGASMERRGPGVLVVHDGKVQIETFPSSLVASAMRDDVPPMQTR